MDCCLYIGVKNQHERQENSQLRSENEQLRSQNMRYKEALASASCPNCGGPTAPGEMSFDEHHLRIENARLREEVPPPPLPSNLHLTLIIVITLYDNTLVTMF